MPSFEPVDGVQARWRHCYDLALKAIERGPREQITLQEVMELLDCDEDTAWQSMRQAELRLEADGHRPLITKPKYGWIVSSTEDAIGLANKKTQKAGRQVKRGVNVLNGASRRREELSQFGRQALDRQMANLTALADLHGRRVVVPLADMERRQLPPAANS